MTYLYNVDNVWFLRDFEICKTFFTYVRHLLTFRFVKLMSCEASKRSGKMNECYV